MRRFLLVLTAIAALYVGGYAALRWRKVLVMHEWHAKGSTHEPHRWVGAGWDFRDDWRGNAKNLISKPATVVFYPLIWVESTARGGRRMPAFAP